MKKIRSNLFTASSAISLALFVVSIGFYVQSAHWPDGPAKSSYQIQVNSGTYFLSRHNEYLQIWRFGPKPHRSEPMVDDGLIGLNHSIGFAGIRLAWFTDSLQPPIPSQFGMFEISFWWFMIAPLLLPLAWLANFLPRNHQRLANTCPSCGYDLRATPHRCPECGAIPAQIKSPTS